MKMPRILNSMEYIDDDLLLKTETYKRQSFNFSWKKSAAVACIGILIIFGIHLLMSSTNNSPFVLTAYAMEKDGSIHVSTLKKGDPVRISMIETKKNTSGFLFSYEAYDEKESAEVIHLALINDEYFDHSGEVGSNLSNQLVSSIDFLKPESNNQYILYVPKQNESAPYSFSLTMKDRKTSAIAEVKIAVIKRGNDYYAFIDEVKIFEKPDNIDELLLPYIEILNKLNDRYGYSLSVPESDIFNFYYTYKDMSPDEFEKEILRIIEEPAAEANGKWDYEIFRNK